MKYIDEYHNTEAVAAFAGKIKSIGSRKWNIMEVCGGQTHAIVRHGLDQLLPDEITLLHGPGCPVCVTPVNIVDKAIEIAGRQNVIFCSFGDMMRVPGSDGDLFGVKSAGGDLRVLYSPLDAIRIAEENSGKEVVFFGIGFETTAPANAMAILWADQIGLENFSVLSAMVLIPPAMELILSSRSNKVDAFLAAGHVCTVSGYEQYEVLSQSYSLPIVVTGFEPLDIIQGIYMAVAQLEDGRAEVENQYSRSVKREGNFAALRIMQEVFTAVDRTWRGFGMIKSSGLAISDKYRRYDAEEKFGKVDDISDKDSECISGDILSGTKKPFDCHAFGNKCTPDNPLGATMVSSEGACSAYYSYRNLDLKKAGLK
ncbi:MAG: hydrogenase formation protein HypD [candidate division Zixibacteria bacterium]|nr:hydrogenase formation protein HypD [candidate division Zixibacteria bacterium]NIR64080.1 hydrogenase formation protein HypD [candidate division Zixibacteria bacterium]NIS15409.1 hydrogenase formation protein HypD [candidate division Zixibacteria bacterium]NIS45978.1 hydrogenase formation protein HypD [candidate division Zixibacteria bacterium]NIT51937.1 hydrogenase formation protein HypD [candidate division Zixibacteria bacterium]